MALSNGPKLGLLVDGLQGEEHYDALMQRWRLLDSLIQPSAKSASTSAPPGSPTDGDTYIVPTGATAGWTGQDGKVARWSSKESTWESLTPKAGWIFYVEDADVQMIYKTAWETFGLTHKCRAYLAGAQTSGAAGWVKVLLDTTSYDTNGMWDATNKRFMPTKPGYYECNLRGRTNSSGGLVTALYKNGATWAAVGSDMTGSAIAAGGSTLVYCNGTTDYLEMAIYTSSARTISPNSYDTFMEVFGPI